MSNHLISVIIPVYNVESYLRKCLDSVVKQTYKNIEIILVDDGSTDHCGEICDEYAQRDSRILVIHKANGGVASSRNTGLDNAKGEYIMWVDSDDWVEPTFCEKALELVLEYHADIVCFGYNSFGPNNYNSPRRTNKPRILDKAEALKHIILFDEPSLFNAVWNRIYHHSLFQNLRFPIGMVYEDNYVTYMLIHKATTIYISDELLYNYIRTRKDSLTGILNNKSKKNTMDMFLIRYQRLLFLKKYYPQLVELQTIELAKIAILRYGLLNDKNPDEKHTRELMYSLLKDNKSLIKSKIKDKRVRFCILNKKTLAIYGFLFLMKKKLELTCIRLKSKFRRV